MTKEEKKEKYKKVNSKRKLYLKKYRETHQKSIFKRLCWSSNFWYKNGEISAFDLWKIAKKQKLKCALTGEKLTSENISIDHIVSKSKGGMNIPSNVRLVLKPINIARQTMTDNEFIELCKKVVNHSSKIV
jgi:5-methylcytosine-specific restriction endonuclease McrA